VEASIFHKLIGKFIKPTKPYTPSLLTQIPHKATATKLVTARLLRVSLTDTSRLKHLPVLARGFAPYAPRLVRT
jgi:hypothetical protein